MTTTWASWERLQVHRMSRRASHKGLPELRQAHAEVRISGRLLQPPGICRHGRCPGLDKLGGLLGSLDMGFCKGKRRLIVVALGGAEREGETRRGN